jgi:hypothetical protein
MGNDNGKLNFDPIPVSGAPRPELPKVPDLPSKLAAAKPPEPTPAEPATPPAPTPTSWLPESVWQAFQPSRTKGVLAAGVISLLGGAATMRYVWPPKPTATAQVEPDRLVAPLPATTNGTAADSFAGQQKAEPASPLAPPPTATTVPLVKTVELPSLTLPTVAASPPAAASPLPALSPPSLPTAAPALPPIGLPVPAATPPVATSPPPVPELKIDLPSILPVQGTAPMTPSPAPAPAVSPLPVPTTTTAPLVPPVSTGTGTAAPAALPLPAITGAAPMAVSPPAQPLPEVKLDPPPMTVATSPTPAAAPDPLKLPPVTATPTTEKKLELPSLETPPVPRIPVTGADPTKVPDIGVPKLPEIGLSPPPTPAPKVELPAVAAEVKPAAVAPALELPVVGAPQPAAVATAAKTDYDVDLHYVKGGDSWASVSKLHYGDERYAEALKGYNQNAALTQMQRAEVPPIHVLRKNFASVIGRPVEKTGEWNTITPSSATEPKRSITGSGYKTYVVPAGGRTIKEIAADAYGDEARWGVVWESNPKLVPDKAIPEGTKIYLTSQAKIGE